MEQCLLTDAKMLTFAVQDYTKVYRLNFSCMNDPHVFRGCVLMMMMMMMSMSLYKTTKLCQMQFILQYIYSTPAEVTNQRF